MEEQAAAPAPVADTAPVEAAPAETPAPVDEVAAATPSDAGRRNPQGDKYKREVNELLTAYETKQARIEMDSQEWRKIKKVSYEQKQTLGVLQK